MNRSTVRLASAVLLGMAGMVGPALANPESYEYRVLHPTYGDIGTYTNIVDRRGDDTEVRTELRVRVTILGIVVYRQEARRIERWHGEKLLSFDGVTLTNGEPVEVHGQVRDGGFAITTPTGTVMAPGHVHPSNPWSAMVLNSDVMMSTRNGRLLPAHVSGGEVRPVSLGGATLQLHQYEIVTYKRQFAWFNDDGVPIAFRIDENGTLIDFLLAHRQELAAGRG